MPAMSDSEIRTIVLGGFERLEMEIDFEACQDLVHFSKGVPYITHLLGIYCARAALADRSVMVDAGHVEDGMNRALDQWQQSIKTLYNDAVRSEQHSGFYKEVLLACALAEVDEQRYFSVSDVKAPLSMIRGKQTEPLIFVRALRDLSESGRGRVLQRTGDPTRPRYRLYNPILRPYIIMRGVREKLIGKDMLGQLAALPEAEPESVV